METTMKHFEITGSILDMDGKHFWGCIIFKNEEKWFNGYMKEVDSEFCYIRGLSVEQGVAFYKISEDERYSTLYVLPKNGITWWSKRDKAGRKRDFGIAKIKLSEIQEDLTIWSESSRLYETHVRTAESRSGVAYPQELDKELLQKIEKPSFWDFLAT